MCKTRTALEAAADKEAKQLAGKQQAKQVESIDKDKAETSLPAVSDSFNHALPAIFEPVSGDNGPEKAVLSDYKEGGGGQGKSETALSNRGPNDRANIY